MKLNKNFTKIYKIIIVIVTLIIGSWCVMFSIDYYRCCHRMSPIFVKVGELNGDIKSYYGIFYKIEQKWGTTPFGNVYTLVLEDRMFLFNKRIY